MHTTMSCHLPSNSSTQRDIFWDITKGVAIFCVVWGHCLQNMTGDKEYWLTDIISQIIISFHMPLFMIVSGYFAYNSLKRPLGGVMRRKVQQLILPSISWYILVWFMAALSHRDFGIERMMDAVNTLPFSFWFLKSLFMCYLICMLGAALYRLNYWFAIIYAVIVVGMGEYLNYVSTISMLPFFVTGLMLHKCAFLLQGKSLPALLGCIAVYASGIMIWDSCDYNIYIKPYSNNWISGGGNPFIIRYLIGASGAISVLIIIKYGIKFISGKVNSWMAQIGTLTLGIYCMQVFLAEGVFKLLAPHSDALRAMLPAGCCATLFYDLIITPLAAVCVISICVWGIGVIKKNRISGLILLGER